VVIIHYFNKNLDSQDNSRVPQPSPGHQEVLIQCNRPRVTPSASKQDLLPRNRGPVFEQSIKSFRSVLGSDSDKAAFRDFFGADSVKLAARSSPTSSDGTMVNSEASGPVGDKLVDLFGPRVPGNAVRRDSIVRRTFRFATSVEASPSQKSLLPKVMGRARANSEASSGRPFKCATCMDSIDEILPPL
jgi:hypothetical protein